MALKAVSLFLCCLKLALYLRVFLFSCWKLFFNFSQNLFSILIWSLYKYFAFDSWCMIMGSTPSSFFKISWVFAILKSFFEISNSFIKLFNDTFWKMGSFSKLLLNLFMNGQLLSKLFNFLIHFLFFKD